MAWNCTCVWTCLSFSSEHFCLSWQHRTLLEAQRAVHREFPLQVCIILPVCICIVRFSTRTHIHTHIRMDNTPTHTGTRMHIDAPTHIHADTYPTHPNMHHAYIRTYTHAHVHRCIHDTCTLACNGLVSNTPGSFVTLPRVLVRGMLFSTTDNST